MVRWCWVNFQCRGVLLIWIIVGQGPTVLAVGAGGGGLDIFSLVYHFSVLSPSLWETARYRLKYCLIGPLSPKQPTNLYAFCRTFTVCFVRRMFRLTTVSTYLFSFAFILVMSKHLALVTSQWIWNVGINGDTKKGDFQLFW